MKTLKNILILFTLLLVCNLNAQSDNSFGIKGGFNYGSNGNVRDAVTNSSENPDSKIGYHFGVYGKLGKKIYLRPELVYTKIQSDYNRSTFDMSKLDLPILVGYKVLGPVSIFAGPSFQYILNTDFEGLNVDNVENDFTVGLQFGVGLSLGKLGIDLRYERGFSSNEATLLDNNNVSVSNRLDTRPEQLILSLSVKL